MLRDRRGRVLHRHHRAVPAPQHVVEHVAHPLALQGAKDAALLDGELVARHVGVVDERVEPPAEQLVHRVSQHRGGSLVHVETDAGPVELVDAVGDGAEQATQSLR